MHEIQLMAHIVNMVREQLRSHPGARPTHVRLKVSPLSHLHGADRSAADSAFRLAARGTAVEGAVLEMLPVPLQVCCRACNAKAEWSETARSCPHCGSSEIVPEEMPELTLDEIVVEEHQDDDQA